MRRGRYGHALQTYGSWSGHFFRRFVHMSMAAIPFVYHAVAPALTPQVVACLLVLLLGIVLLEVLRLRWHIVCFGQRYYEKTQIASFTWGAAAIIVVLLASPAYPYTVAIILSCALGDPFLGELRSRLDNPYWVALIGIFFVSMIWLGCAYLYGFSYGWVGLAPLIVLAECIKIKQIDDNALMLWVPLIPLWIIKLYNHY